MSIFRDFVSTPVLAFGCESSACGLPAGGIYFGMWHAQQQQSDSEPEELEEEHGDDRVSDVG